MKGALWKMKMVTATVTRVIKEQDNNRMSTSIEAIWDISGDVKTAKMRLGSMKVADDTTIETKSIIASMVTQDDIGTNKTPQRDPVTPSEGAEVLGTSAVTSDSNTSEQPIVDCTASTGKGRRSRCKSLAFRSPRNER